VKVGLQDSSPAALGDLVKVKHGFAFKGEGFRSEETPYLLLTPGNFAIGGGFQFRPGRETYFAGEVPDEYILSPGDLVVTMTDLSRETDTLGYPALVPAIEGLSLLHNQRIGRVSIIDETVCERRFLYYLMCSREYREEILASATGSTVKHTAPSRIEAFKFELPGLDEQRAIARTLSALDEKIALNRRMNRTLEALAQKLFKSWFVDFDPVVAKSQGRKPFGLSDELASLFPSEFEDADQGPIPSGWGVSVIGQEASIVGGSTPATDEPEYWMDGRHCWVTPRDLSRLEDPVLLDTERKITDAGLARISSGLLPAGTVLLSSRAPIGYVAVAGVPTAINQGFIAIQCDKSLPNQFVRQWVSENMGEIEARAGGTTFAEISKSAFRPIPVLVPSTELLVAFQAQAETLFDRLSQNVKQSNALAKLRDLLLPRLLSGELRVPDAEREVEAIL